MHKKEGNKMDKKSTHDFIEDFQAKQKQDEQNKQRQGKANHTKF